jgi:TM2 domain-containing membrane protein YozV
MKKVDTGTAYILWCLGLLGVCGAHRLYTGKIVTGLIYFLTGGLCFIGQLIDLRLIPSMVEERNTYLRRRYGSMSGLHASVPLDRGEIPPLDPSQHLQTANHSTVATLSPMQKLLKAAQENGGQLSMAQAAMYTGFPPAQLQQLLHEAAKAGYAEIGNDPQTGAIRYYFDL